MIPSLLFVCSQNTCRSVAAQAVFSYLLSQAGIDSAQSGVVDSAGLSAVPGRGPDALLQEAAARRGYQLNHQSRLLADNDFESFDQLLAVDLSSFNGLRGRGGRHCQGKIKLLMDYAGYFSDNEVAYPSSGDIRDFMRIFDYVEDACLGLFRTLRDGA